MVNGSPSLLDPADAASVLRLSSRTIERYAAAGLLTKVRVGPRVKYRASEVSAMHRQRLAAGGARMRQEATA